MKHRPVLKNSYIRTLSMTFLIAGFGAFALIACGGKFEAMSATSEARPPATSDPYSAEEQRRWDSADEAQVSAPILEGDAERDNFLSDLTEQKPAHTDEQIGEEAERIYEARERNSKNKKPNSSPEAQRPQTSSEPIVASPVPNQASPSAPNQPAPQNQTQTPATPNPNPARPAPTTNQNPVRPPQPNSSQTTAATSGRPSMPATMRPRAQAPTRSLRSEFCENLNVTSGAGKADLSPLYNNAKAYATAMPNTPGVTSEERKNRFVCTLLPMAIGLNEEVFRQRVEVLRLQTKQKKGQQLTDEDEKWLIDIKKAYGLETDSSYVELLKRVDIVPLPLLLAQAALESGWGTSKATKDLKNLFGIHAVSGQKCKTGYDTNNACVREYDTLAQGVSSYIRLINTGRAYPGFRELRAKMRQDGEAMDSVKLLGTLGKYNETPVQYIRTVREVMTGSNKLTQFNFREESVRIEN